MKGTGRREFPKSQSNAGDFALEIRIRGKVDALHRETCQDLEDAVRMGEKWFRAFQARNPRFVQDSARKRIFILLDSRNRKPDATVNTVRREISYTSDGTDRECHFPSPRKSQALRRASYAGASSVASDSLWLMEPSNLRSARTCTLLTGISRAIAF
jgi:hypothetical protein